MDRLMVIDARCPPGFRSHFGMADTLRFIAYDLGVLELDIRFDNPGGVIFGKVKDITRRTPVHGSAGKPPHRIYADDIVFPIERIPGVNHPARQGVHHSGAPHRHGDIFIPKPAVESIGDGGKSVLAGNHKFIGRKQAIGGNIEFRLVLSGK